ncbi:MAG: hypothetical protein TREMPRED_004111 [Tremellales sp. Tagirdzhanova-0007]|nr:MAG: hypothetical protein TREMPRED_004111 [Tremellales sp. Tagirdzhanova-0007]
MSVHEVTYSFLIDMGIEPPLARAAATRFHNVEPAVNWCFGDGMSWKPEPDIKSAPSSRQSDQTRESLDFLDLELFTLTTKYSIYFQELPTHSEKPLYDYTSDLPDHQIRAHPFTFSDPGPTLQSNNPFLHVAPASPAPPVQNKGNGDDDNDDVQLGKALSMLTEIDGDDNRQERERSERANGAPPPSPVLDNGTMTGTLFGPSERTDEDGKMALVPAASDAPNQNSKEDDDLNRAIQDSLMTASFHSASAPREFERPKPVLRQSGAPLALFSESGHSTYAATFLQALLAIPQVREAITRSIVPPVLAETGFAELQDLVHLLETADESFIEIDFLLQTLRNGAEPSQLPPEEPTQRLHDRMIAMLETASTSARSSDSVTIDGASDDYWANPERLFSSRIDSDRPYGQKATHVQFLRHSSRAMNLQSALADVLWSPESPGQSIEVLSDVLTVKLGWAVGATRELWKLEESVVLGRSPSRASWVDSQIRGQQAVAAGNVRRLKDKIDGLTIFKEQNLHHSIAILVKLYETSLHVDDDLQTQAREEMKTKLENTLAVLKLKVAELKEQLEAENSVAEGALFRNDDPEHRQHVYLLRAVLFHTGALVAGKQLYAYIRSENGTWWRIQEHEITMVEWEAVRDDKTGLFMDAGPYLLMYSRDGPRPASRQEQQNDVKADEIEVDEPMEVVEVSAASEASPSRSILGFEVESKESGAEIPEDTIGR